MRRIALVVGAMAFFLNPALACTGDDPGDDPGFQYGSEEMRAAVEGVWVLDVTWPGGARLQTTFQLKQASAQPDGGAATATRGGMQPFVIRSAHACGTRTLVRPAGACLDSTVMPLEVTVVSSEPALGSTSVSGSLSVYSLVFSQGTLSLTLGDLSAGATIAADATVQQAYANGPSGSGVATLARQAR